VARNSAAKTATNPVVQVAMEQHEPPHRRLVDDDLAASMLPAPQRLLVRAMRWTPLRRLVIAAGERAVPGSWTIITCRKRFIDDTLAAALPHIDAVVILGAGMDTLGLRLARRSGIPVFEVDLAENIAAKQAAITRAVGTVPASVRLVPVDFERDDLIEVLAASGYQTDARTFFIWEGVTQYLTEDAVRATLAALRPASVGSRLACTFVRKDFVEGQHMYGAELLYKRFVERHPIWRFGLDPQEVAAFVVEYGWRVVEQTDREYFLHHYIRPTGRNLSASALEWSVYAEKTFEKL
jgi:methyltransferase (TIGR00027 family)